MKEIFRFFAERHKLATLATIMIILMGSSALMKMQRDNYPPVDLGEMTIQTMYPGAAPEDVELNVTNQIEDQLKNVVGIKTMTSFSMENMSIIKIGIDPNVRDQVRVKNDIRDAVSRVTKLPVEVEEAPLVTEVKTSIFPILEVGIAGELPYADLREIVRRLEKKILTVPGVAGVSKFGYRAREIKIEVNQDKIRYFQIPLSMITQAIQCRNVRATGGSFESYTDEKNVVTLAQFSNPLEVGDVIVRTTFEGPQIKVKDLAIIRDDFADETIIPRLNGKKVISLNITKNESADIIRTVDSLRELLDKEKGDLPKDVEIIYSSDESKTVKARFNIVISNGLTGLLLVIVMLTLFLNFRTAFWVAMGIPTTLLGVFAVMPLFGAHLDSMTLSAMILVLGILVDDAIIISENITRRVELGDSPDQAAAEGTREVFLPVLTTVLTTFLAFVPMFFMPGVMGKFVYLIPLVISLSLFISLGESCLILPAHIVHSLKKHVPKNNTVTQKGFFETIRVWFERMLYHLLRMRYACVTFFVGMMLITLLYAVMGMDFILMPAAGAERFVINMQLPIGTSLQATSDAIAEVEAKVKTIPTSELASFVTRIGQGLTLTEQGEYYGYIDVRLTPFGKRVRTADEIIKDLRAQCDHLKRFEKITFSVFTGGPPVGKPVSIKVVGHDDQKRAQLSDALESFLKTINGVKDISRDDHPGKEQVEIHIDYEQLARVELTVADIAQNVRIAYDGQLVTSLRYGDENVKFRLQFPIKARGRIGNLRELLIPNQQRRLIPLKTVATMKTGPGPSTYQHYNGERTTTVEADIDKTVTTPLKIIEQVTGHFNLERDWPEFRFELGGEARETRESMMGLLAAFVIAFLAIYFLLVLQFDSMTQPVLVLVAIPFGLIGVIITFMLHGQALGFMALMGVIGLAGVVVNDSIVLVDHLNTLKKERNDENLLRTIALGTSNRLRAIILTTVTTVAGLVPLAYGIGGADVFMGPMAMALGFGLLFATPLTLILVPCLYAIGNDFGSLKRKLFKRSAPREVDQSQPVEEANIKALRRKKMKGIIAFLSIVLCLSLAVNIYLLFFHEPGPALSHSGEPDPTSFLGLLRARSGIALDLPLEAQWEYACRATTTKAYNNNGDCTVISQDETPDPQLEPLGWYWANWPGEASGQGTREVGLKKPNLWGLYDMHGNVWELCRDRFADYTGDAVDPIGPAQGMKRVARGGSWHSWPSLCRSATRVPGKDPFRAAGFRISCQPDDRAQNAQFIIIDLSPGPQAAQYPVLFLDGPPKDLLDNPDYKTTKIVLRRIQEGTFTMGSPVNERGRSDNEQQHQVRLTHDFFMGMYEITQKQWSSVMGTNPSYYKGETLPVEGVTWKDDIRGGTWPPT